MIGPASVIGLISYASAGYARWGAALALGAGAAAVAPLGARTALAMKPRLLKRLFALVQAGAGVLLVVGQRTVNRRQPRRSVHLIPSTFE